jgi:hypothetical protein
MLNALWTAGCRRTHALCWYSNTGGGGYFFVLKRQHVVLNYQLYWMVSSIDLVLIHLKLSTIKFGSAAVACQPIERIIKKKTIEREC